jgi:hypothetical protein
LSVRSQHKSFGDNKAGPRGIMIQEVFNRNQQNKGGNLHLQTQSSVNASNNDNNGNNSNNNQNSKQGKVQLKLVILNLKS